MFDFLFLFIIIAALGVVAYIVLRKFFQLSNLDLESLEEEKTERRKKQIIAGRVDERSKEMKSRWQKRFLPMIKFWKKKQFSFRVYVGKIERLFRHEQAVKDREESSSLTVGEKEKKMNDLLKAAEKFFDSGDYDQAEELYISMIKINNKLAVAYRGLAETYLKKGENEEAMQTFNFLSQLTPDDDTLLIRLGDVFEEQGNVDKAIKYYEQAVVLNDAIASRFYHLAELLLRVKQAEVALEAASQAVELEPKNPKYLDLLIECAIICNILSVAQKGYEDLRMVNPDNQKLEEYKERIANLSKT